MSERIIRGVISVGSISPLIRQRPVPLPLFEFSPGRPRPLEAMTCPGDGFRRSRRSGSGRVIPGVEQLRPRSLSWCPGSGPHNAAWANAPPRRGRHRGLTPAGSTQPPGTMFSTFQSSFGEQRGDHPAQKRRHNYGHYEGARHDNRPAPGSPSVNTRAITASAGTSQGVHPTSP